MCQVGTSLLAGYLLVSRLRRDTLAQEFLARVVGVGLGMGIVNSPNSSAIMGAVPRERLRVASGLLASTRTRGQTTEVALVGASWAALTHPLDFTGVSAAVATPALTQLRAMRWTSVGLALDRGGDRLGPPSRALDAREHAHPRRGAQRPHCRRQVRYPSAMKVAVLGASDHPDRYSHAAVLRLRAQRHEVIGVNPRLPDLGDVPVVASLRELPRDVHTVTVYLAPERSEPLAQDFASMSAQRIIFNPGSENAALQRLLEERGVRVIEACTLVLLATGRFDSA